MKAKTKEFQTFFLFLRSHYRELQNNALTVGHLGVYPPPSSAVFLAFLRCLDCEGGIKAHSLICHRAHLASGSQCKPEIRKMNDGSVRKLHFHIAYLFTAVSTTSNLSRTGHYRTQQS